MSRRPATEQQADQELAQLERRRAELERVIEHVERDRARLLQRRAVR
jgi:type II secretory pathway component PulJ